MAYKIIKVCTYPHKLKAAMMKTNIWKQMVLWFRIRIVQKSIDL